jgi:hypothetical protein
LDHTTPTSTDNHTPGCLCRCFLQALQLLPHPRARGCWLTEVSTARWRSSSACRVPCACILVPPWLVSLCTMGSTVRASVEHLSSGCCAPHGLPTHNLRMWIDQSTKHNVGSCLLPLQVQPPLLTPLPLSGPSLMILTRASAAPPAPASVRQQQPPAPLPLPVPRVVTPCLLPRLRLRLLALSGAL